LSLQAWFEKHADTLNNPDKMIFTTPTTTTTAATTTTTTTTTATTTTTTTTTTATTTTTTTTTATTTTTTTITTARTHTTSITTIMTTTSTTAPTTNMPLESLTNGDSTATATEFTIGEKKVPSKVIKYVKGNGEKHPKAKILAAKKKFVAAKKNWEAKNLKKRSQKIVARSPTLEVKIPATTTAKLDTDVTTTSTTAKLDTDVTTTSTTALTAAVITNVPMTTTTGTAKVTITTITTSSTFLGLTTSATTTKGTKTTHITTTTISPVVPKSKPKLKKKLKISYATKDILVCSRVRPIFESELETGNFSIVNTKERTSFIHEPLFHTFTGKAKPKTRMFKVDRAFGPKDDSKKVYNMIGAPLIPIVIEGGTGTLLAYGQTGSGKTFTMSAILNFVSEDLFQKISLDSHRCSVVVLEMKGDGQVTYNSSDSMVVTCLQSHSEVRIKENRFSDIVVEGAVETEVKDAQEFLKLITTVLSTRKTVATIRNPVSSRSHLIIRIRLKALDISLQESNVDDGILYIADLAGSETAADRYCWLDGSSNDDARVLESRHINLSLMNLKQCISARGQAGRGKHVHIPYRSSKLTLLLKDAFELAVKRPAKLGVVACFSPLATDATHSINTLKYTAELKAGPPIKIIKICIDPATWTKLETTKWLMKNNIDPNAMLPNFGDNGRTLAKLTGEEFVNRATKTDKVSSEHAMKVYKKLWSNVADARRKFEGQKKKY